MQFQTDQINQLIRQRRSIKPASYSGEPVDDKVIHQMLENAKWAPTHGITEPWHFVIFKEDGRKLFADISSSLYKRLTPPEQFLENKYQKLLQTPTKASHLILICMKRQLNGKIPEIEEVCSVACAVQNMMLTATAYGVGSYWSTGGMSGKEEMKEFLELTPADKCLGILYVGNYVNRPEMPARTDISAKTRWVSAS